MSSDRLKLSMHQKVLRYRFEKWFWWFMSLLVVFLDIEFAHLWLQISIVYIAFVSNYALALTAGGAEQAAEAALQASDEESPT